MLIAIVCCIFISVALLSGAALYSFLPKRDVMQERLEKMASPKAAPVVVTLTEVKPKWRIAIENLGAKLPVAPQDQSKYTRSLVAAGMKKESLYLFVGSKLVLAFLFPAIFVFGYALPKGVLLEVEPLMYATGLAIFGFLLPSAWLTQMVKVRQTEIFHTLPDILDLLTVCVEAGLGIDGALNRTCENPQFAGNPLAEELKIAAGEIRAGKPRYDALRDMADRTMVDDVKSFVTMLVQTERFGTSLSLALRVHSDSLRTKRRQIAEERAAKTAVKILFPLMFFIFPALMAILIGPAFFKLMDIFK